MLNDTESEEMDNDRYQLNPEEERRYDDDDPRDYYDYRDYDDERRDDNTYYTEDDTRRSEGNYSRSLKSGYTSVTSDSYRGHHRASRTDGRRRRPATPTTVSASTYSDLTAEGWVCFGAL